MEDDATGPCDAFIPYQAVVTTILAVIYIPTQMIFICALYRLSTRRTLSDVILALISITDSVTFILYTIRVDGNRYLTPTAVQSRLWVTASLVLVYSTNTLNAFSQYLITLLAYYRIRKMRSLFQVQSARKRNAEARLFKKTVVLSFVGMLQGCSRRLRGAFICWYVARLFKKTVVLSFVGILLLSTPMFTSGVVRSTSSCFVINNALDIYHMWQRDKTSIWSDHLAQQHNETFWNEFVALLFTETKITASKIDIAYENENMLCIEFLDESVVTPYSVYVTYDILPVVAHWITGIVFKGVPCLAVMVATPLIIRQLIIARRHHDKVRITTLQTRSVNKSTSAEWKKFRRQMRSRFKNEKRVSGQKNSLSETDLQSVGLETPVHQKVRHQQTVIPGPITAQTSSVPEFATHIGYAIIQSAYRSRILTLKNQMLVLIMLIFLAAQLPVLVLSIGSSVGDIEPASNKLFVIYSSCGPIFDIVTLLSGSAYFIVYALMSQQIRESIVSMFVNNRS